MYGFRFSISCAEQNKCSFVNSINIRVRVSAHIHNISFSILSRTALIIHMSSPFQIISDDVTISICKPLKIYMRSAYLLAQRNQEQKRKKESNVTKPKKDGFTNCGPKINFFKKKEPKIDLYALNKSASSYHHQFIFLPILFPYEILNSCCAIFCARIAFFSSSIYSINTLNNGNKIQNKI